jgi:hypothetical protein
LVAEGGGHADGIYKAASAGHIIDKFAADGELPIKDLAAVRLSTVNGQQVAAALSSGGLQAALAEICANFESPLLRALPVGLLRAILSERGGLDMDTLKAIDALLRGRGLTIDPASQQQIERVGQWLRIALDNPGMIDDLVNRIPLLGAKGVAGLLETIGRVNAWALPEQFFATEDKVLANALFGSGAASGINNIGINSAINTNNAVSTNSAVNTAGSANLLAALAKSAFSAAPTALLDLVKQIDASSAPAAKPLPQAEARRIAGQVANSLSTNAAAKPEFVHDSTRLSPRVLETDAAPPAKTPAAAARQIRSVYSELTEAAVRALVGGNGRGDAAAIGEKINALREAVCRMPIVAAERPQPITNNPNAVNMRDANAPSASNVDTTVNRAFSSTSGANAANNITENSQPAAGANLGNAKAIDNQAIRDIGVNSAKAADAPPAVNKYQGADRAPGQQLVQTQAQTSVQASAQAPAQTPMQTSIQAPTQASTQMPVQASVQASVQTPVQTSAQASLQTPAQMSTQASTQTSVQASIQTPTQTSPPTPAQEPARTSIQTSARTIDVNTHRVNVADGSLSVDKHSASVDKPAARMPAQTSGIGAGSDINKPIDISAVKENSLRIIDALKAAAAPILRELAQAGSIDAGGKAQLLGLIREAASSLDGALRPAAREERPVPPEFYERVASGAKHQISAEAKSALFSQIGAAQEAIRGAIEAAERAAAAGGKNPSNVIGINNNSRQSLPVDKNMQNVAGINANLQQPLSADKNAPIAAGIDTNARQPLHAGKNMSAISGINANTPPPVDKSISTASAVNSANPRQPPPAGKNAPADSGVNNINIDNNAPAKPGVNNANPQPPLPSPLISAAPAQPPGILRLSQQMWAGAERLRDGFQEAFSSLDLQNRVSPLRLPPDQSAFGAIRQGADSLRTEVLLDVSRALREVNSALDGLREIASRLSCGPGLLPDAEKALLRAAESLERHARESGAEVAERLRGVLRELSRLQADAARAQGHTGAGAGAARPSPMDAIRSAALAAARGLENLQLLSAQARGAEAEQQFLALPVKIGGEWAEVQVKFVKERKRAGGAGGGHVSIYLKAAPSALGQVAAHLDYHPPNLKLSFQFEKPEATAWFRERSGELRGALAEAGLPGAALEFNTRRSAPKGGAASAPAPENADLGANAAGAAVDGKVDFRA